MIHFVTTRTHSYTLKKVVQRHGKQRCRQWTYERLFILKSIPTGTWIFTDHERLSAHELEKAARIATILKDGGSRVLNHPALVRGRFELLRRLHEAGINSFSIMRCESSPRPSRFPVFIRNEFDHNSSAISLIETQADLEDELQQMEKRGIPLVGKIVIEYASEEIFPKLWHRLATYRVADKTMAHHVAFGDSWLVKDGLSKEAKEAHPDREKIIAFERDFVTQNLYDDVLKKVFAIARIEYGRADFSIVNNQVQIYEINTNPNHAAEPQVIGESTPQDQLLHIQTENELQDAIININQPDDGKIEINDSLIKRLKGRYWGMVRSGWRP